MYSVRVWEGGIYHSARLCVSLEVGVWYFEGKWEPGEYNTDRCSLSRCGSVGKDYVQAPAAAPHGRSSLHARVGKSRLPLNYGATLTLSILRLLFSLHTKTCHSHAGSLHSFPRSGLDSRCTRRKESSSQDDGGAHATAPERPAVSHTRL
jgi:hypothetical protein